MIVSIRIDDRLIHGQVALVWSKELNTTRIVVANDEAARNDVMKMTLKMATPAGIKLLIKPLKESIDVFNNPRSQDLKLFVLTNCVQDTLEIVKNCPDVESVNVANVGRFDESDPALKTQLNPCIILNPQELEALKELAKCQLPVYAQVVPTNPKTPIQNLLDGMKG